MFDTLSAIELTVLRRRAAEVDDCAREIARTGRSVVEHLLGTEHPGEPWRHYPPGDVYDPLSHAQYYYHLHPEAERPADEFGHFHTFLRPQGMPTGTRPAALADYRPPEDPNDALSHLIAIATDIDGRPNRLFTVNRWVTGETWYRAADVIAMLDQFSVDVDRPFPAVSRWVTALIRLVGPLIASLIAERDERLDAWRRRHPEINAYEDRRLEVVSQASLDVAAYTASIDTELARRKGVASTASLNPR